ncbi:MAG TPA: hypothetical protein VMT61_04725 [Candidatus Binataceae bacterium]|nr:hypothetical protein [Candidatus Binataceae bacterium]
MTIWIAAVMLIASVALFVAAPLTDVFTEPKSNDDETEELRFEHLRNLATSAIRELEFDYATGKMTEAEFRNLRNALENRALTAMAELERLGKSAKASRQT